MLLWKTTPRGPDAARIMPPRSRAGPGGAGDVVAATNSETFARASKDFYPSDARSGFNVCALIGGQPDLDLTGTDVSSHVYGFAGEVHVCEVEHQFADVEVVARLDVSDEIR